MQPTSQTTRSSVKQKKSRPSRRGRQRESATAVVRLSSSNRQPAVPTHAEQIARLLPQPPLSQYRASTAAPSPRHAFSSALAPQPPPPPPPRLEPPPLRLQMQPPAQPSFLTQPPVQQQPPPHASHLDTSVPPPDFSQQYALLVPSFSVHQQQLPPIQPTQPPPPPTFAPPVESHVFAPQFHVYAPSVAAAPPIPQPPMPPQQPMDTHNDHIVFRALMNALHGQQPMPNQQPQPFIIQTQSPFQNFR